MPLYHELLSRLEDSIEFLADRPEENARTTLRSLWFTAACQPRSAEFADSGDLPELDAAGKASLQRLIERRLSGEPLPHVSGRQRFMGIEMLASEAALVPRKETELLASTAQSFVEEALAHTARPLVLDTCTGSGNVALAIASRFAAARVLGADLSESAVQFARCNAQFTGLADRVEFRTGDLLQPFQTLDIVSQVDVISCNPPYISSTKVRTLAIEIGAHEPALAFDGGPFGVGILMRLLREAPAFLRPGGWLTFEVGRGQGPGLAKRMQALPAFHDVRAAVDRGGDIRVVSGRC